MGEFENADTLVLRNETNEKGLMYRAVRLDGGGLVIEGHDIGRGVEDYWGDSEYEFTRTYTREQTSELARLLGCSPGKELLAAISAQFPSTNELESFAIEHGIRGDFWSRSGSLPHDRADHLVRSLPFAHSHCERGFVAVARRS